MAVGILQLVLNIIEFFDVLLLRHGFLVAYAVPATTLQHFFIVDLEQLVEVLQLRDLIVYLHYFSMLFFQAVIGHRGTGRHILSRGIEIELLVRLLSVLLVKQTPLRQQLI